MQIAVGGPPDKGWAVVPQTGQSHTAVFETHDNIAGPGVFTIHMEQNFPDGQHTLGRFRISVTNAPRPVTVGGPPANIADILAVAGDKRTEKQKAELLAHYRSIDAELKQRSEALAMAKQPLPVDTEARAASRRAGGSRSAAAPGCEARTSASRHVETQSPSQLEKIRLTFAQTSPGPLINSPAFLF